MKNMLFRAMIGAAVAVASVMPAAAQLQSDSYKFLKAVRDQDVLKAKELFDKPGSTVVNTKDYSSGETALHIVVKRRDVPWINFLAKAGANPELRDEQGRTPLILASQLAFADGVRVLLYHGADPNGTNSRGETPLIFAVQTRDPDTVRALIEGGADPDQQDRYSGRSARDYAKHDPRGAALLKIMEAAKPRKAAPPKMVGPQL